MRWADGRARWAAALACCAGALFGGGARAEAEDAGGRTQPPPSSAPRPAAAGTAGDDDEDDEMPPGHPPVEGASPHAHPASGQGMPGVFQPPEDTEQPDPSLAPGTIEVDLRDADDRPVPREAVTLGILVNSVAKGDSRRHVQTTTGDDGRAVFGGLDTSTSSTAYRVSSGYDGGLFAAAPFQLQQVHAMRVILHVYHVVRDLRLALIVCEATVAADLKDDRMQIEEALNVYNLGRTAWQPDDVRIPLPDGFTAFTAQASMSDQGVDQSGKIGRASCRERV